MNVLSASLLAAAAFSHAPQSAAPIAERAQVMILGVYHFENPGLDYVKSPTIDHLSPAKQDEIAEVLDRLTEFAPTKIVLEAEPENDTIQQRYRAYLDGKLELAGDEREQLGFRLGKHFAHERMVLADHQLPMDLGAVLDAARASGDERFLAWFQGAAAEAQAMIERHAKLSVRETLVELNEPGLQDETRELYLQLARVRSAAAHVGADVLADWYKRNFCIFTNLSQAIEAKDRVLVIFGQNHVPYLRELVKSSPDLELVEPNAYLD